MSFKASEVCGMAKNAFRKYVHSSLEWSAPFHCYTVQLELLQ